MNKAVVTGATGFLGKALTLRLLEQGVTVYGVGTDEDRLAELAAVSENFVPICATFDLYGDLPQMIDDDNIDVFYHFAWAGGFTKALADYEIQFDNAKHSVDAVVAAHALGAAKYVYANTYNQFEILNFLRTDGFVPRATCIYATAKTAANLVGATVAASYGMDYCAGLVPMPYGVGNRSMQLINVVLDSLNKGIPPKLIQGNNLYDVVHVDDVALAFVAIGEAGKNQRNYYIGHRELRTFREWMLEIRDAVAPSVDLRFGEYPDLQSIDYDDVDLDLLYRDTGFECRRELDEEIKKVADWLKAAESVAV